MVLLNIGTDEVEAWKRLIDREFLDTEVIPELKDIPNTAGEYLRWIVEHVSEQMKFDDLSPENLRDIRNSHHGYKLHPGVFNRLMEKTGEFNNDITLILTPLTLFFLSKKWEIK